MVMKGKLLFVNACLKGEDSRTLRICRAFLGEIDGMEIEELKLAERFPKPFEWDDVIKRDELALREAWGDGMFALARQYKSADAVLIGAPYWDLSFPAVLKAYFERICVAGLTFRYTETGMEGISGVKKTVYITTAGGFIGEKNFGAQYAKGVSDMLGCGDFSFVAAEGLDIIGMNIEEPLSKAEKQAKELAKQISACD